MCIWMEIQTCSQMTLCSSLHSENVSPDTIAATKDSPLAQVVGLVLFGMEHHEFYIHDN